MLARTTAVTVLGVEARPIEVEVDLSIGLAQFTIVGLPDGTIKESRERIAAAANLGGNLLPARRIASPARP